ncbi:AzlC family ABC transporter permease [Pseudoduganella sp. SL102]|uniref:AzlC family protein n=1 Tax=Pseudoduganella albidiflava TaxID=321983 RepID=A0A411WSF7_9BURK|nr:MULTISPECIES: AzlC family ABC transporter permease [Pseudoduganella]QBH99587.1 branched-chain amino acid ABC transporter permease [Pseudoduganella albidiflava]WBS02453.1 AzlC family ABC transporter permease [Pseudoduganella sp. SL102]GGY46000.1 AzlC family protein [Pseudoduganella albidiflava]
MSDQDFATHDPAAWRDGFRTGLPTLFGIGAWGVVVGVAMIKSGLSIPQALGMTLLVFAGSAQLAALPLIAANAPIWVIFVTALVINLRFVIFSVLLAPHFASLPWHKRLGLGFVSGDISVALYLQRYPDPEPAPGKVSFLKGLLYPNCAAWQIGSIIGIFLGNAVPTEWGLGFAGTLAIVCILVPMVASMPALCGVLVAAAVSVLAADLPYKLGLLAAVVVGMVTAMVVEETGDRRRAKRKENGEANHV